jgi:hypothetical protein
MHGANEEHKTQERYTLSQPTYLIDTPTP